MYPLPITTGIKFCVREQLITAFFRFNEVSVIFTTDVFRRRRTDDETGQPRAIFLNARGIWPPRQDLNLHASAFVAQRSSG
jgi:hypothetical protein